MAPDGFYPVSTEGLEEPENFRSCLATRRRIRGLMEPLDVIEQIRLGNIEGRACPAVRALPFQHAEKALAGSVVAAVADSTPGAKQRAACKQRW